MNSKPATWRADERDRLDASLQLDPDHMYGQRPLPASPRAALATGLQDYRGAPLHSLIRFDIVEADFSEARSTRNNAGVDQGITVSACRCRHVRFDGAGPFHLIGGIYDQCSFDRLRTDHCGFTGLYRDCTFKGSNLRRAMLAGDFVRCAFDGANLLVDSWGGASFTSCRFRNCRISALFPDVRAALGSGECVSFSVLIGGRVKVGTAVKCSHVDALRHGWDDGGA
jgi:hypothetical protein